MKQYLYLGAFLVFHAMSLLFFCKAFGVQARELKEVGQILTKDMR